MKEKLYNFSPNMFQNILISLYNYLEYKKRYGKNYKCFKNIFNANKRLSRKELFDIQKVKYKKFINFTINNSSFYKNLYNGMENIDNIENISKLPIINKETLRANIEDIYTVPMNKGIISKTGGTTGKSLKVYFTIEDMQERFALLDTFRSCFGYQLGKRTAWFSGKNLLVKRDVKKHRFWKTDYLYNVRYYSTFHVKESYLKYYIEDLIKFKPEYLVGFPSSILEIAKFGLKNKYEFPKDTVKAIFPTAETITNEMRVNIEAFFKSKVYDQYASSEGAPFIFECENRNKHLELQSGVFEVLDDFNQPVKEGKLVVTSFTTKGTPLIRYDIGDSIELSDEVCTCGNNNPLVKSILGRVDDFIYSPQNGKINLGNISNTLKNTDGIVKFQVIQDELNKIKIMLVIDTTSFNAEFEKVFLKNWKERIGNEMHIELEYVTEIPNENSGKYRMVKNNIKHLI